MSMAYTAVALVVVSTAATVYSQQQAAATQTKAAEYNNKLAEAEAKNRELEMAEQLKRQRIKDRRAMAQIRNRLANSGTLTTEGTPLAILGESAANFNLGIQDAARASNMQAASLRAEGQMGLWNAAEGQKAANIESVATVANAAASAYTGYTTRTKRA